MFVEIINCSIWLIESGGSVIFFVGRTVTAVELWVESFEISGFVDECVVFDLVVSEYHWFPGSGFIFSSSLSFLLTILVKRTTVRYKMSAVGDKKKTARNPTREPKKYFQL